MSLKQARCFVEVITPATQMTHAYDYLMSPDVSSTLFVDLSRYVPSDPDEPDLRTTGDTRGESVDDPVIMNSTAKSKSICLLLTKGKPPPRLEHLSYPSSGSSDACPLPVSSATNILHGGFPKASAEPPSETSVTNIEVDEASLSRGRKRKASDAPVPFPISSYAQWQLDNAN